MANLSTIMLPTSNAGPSSGLKTPVEETHMEGSQVSDFGGSLSAPKRCATYPPVSFESNGKSATVSNQSGNPESGLPAIAKILKARNRAESFT